MVSLQVVFTLLIFLAMQTYKFYLNTYVVPCISKHESLDVEQKAIPTAFFPCSASLWNSYDPSILFQEESQFPTAAPLSLLSGLFSTTDKRFLDGIVSTFNNYTGENFCDHEP